MAMTHSKKHTLIFCVCLFLSRLAWAHSNSVHIWEEGNYRYIESNGIPDHAPGQFPNSGNPNTISSKHYLFRVPSHPNLNSFETLYSHDLFGVELNGVPFDPGTAEFWNNDRNSGWNYEALSGKINLGLDQSNAHVQPDGAYHYHGVPKKALSGGNALMQLIGYAADGFPIYFDASVESSYQLKQGMRPSGPGNRYDGTFVEDYEYVPGAGDLDVCNGQNRATAEFPEGIYHYYLTDEFPFVPRCLKGTPDPSFKKQKPGQRQQGRSGGGRSSPGGIPPKEAIAACSNHEEGDPCSFLAPHGTVRGTCRNLGDASACVPS